MSADLLQWAFAGLFSIIAWFLRSKDAAQAEQIRDLYRKHEEDAKALAELRVQIAAKHYERPELDAKFDKLDTTFREGFNAMGAKLDRLSESLIGHMSATK
jgi:hypothetical protein